MFILIVKAHDRWVWKSVTQLFVFLFQRASSGKNQLNIRRISAGAHGADQCLLVFFIRIPAHADDRENAVLVRARRIGYEFRGNAV